MNCSFVELQYEIDSFLVDVSDSFGVKTFSSRS